MKSIRIRQLPFLALAAFLTLSAACLQADVLTTATFTTSSGAGGTGAASTNCMIMSDGTSWSGGAVGVQGDATTGVGNVTPLAANVTFKFNVGSFVDSLNATYGVGCWSITNPTLTLQYTLYANNSRFGGGAGTFDVYWVSNDTWVQGTSNPVYATSEAALSAWSTNSNLGEQYYSWSTASYTGTTSDVNTSVWTTDKTGVRQSTMTLSLDLTSELLSDILNASATGTNSDVSLYLMATDSTTGLTIFTGGGSSQPTLGFTVVSTPEPSTFALVLGGLFLLWRLSGASRRRRLGQSAA